jgi:hypothetical protein
MACRRCRVAGCPRWLRATARACGTANVREASCAHARARGVLDSPRRDRSRSIAPWEDAKRPGLERTAVLFPTRADRSASNAATATCGFSARAARPSSFRLHLGPPARSISRSETAATARSSVIPTASVSTGTPRHGSSDGSHAGIDKRVGPHTLRHAFITAALDAGVPLRDVQEAASHADPRTTMRYDRARVSLDRHATYIIATFIAGAAR